MTVTVVDDLVTEAIRLESILDGLTDAQWRTESGAVGWSVADVVLHLAQTDEGVVASMSGAGRPDGTALGTVDDWAARMVALNGPRKGKSSPGGGGHARRRWTRCGPPIRNGRSNG